MERLFQSLCRSAHERIIIDAFVVKIFGFSVFLIFPHTFIFAFSVKLVKHFRVPLISFSFLTLDFFFCVHSVSFFISMYIEFEFDPLCRWSWRCGRSPQRASAPCPGMSLSARTFGFLTGRVCAVWVYILSVEFYWFFSKISSNISFCISVFNPSKSLGGHVCASWVYLTEIPSSHAMRCCPPWFSNIIFP